MSFPPVTVPHTEEPVGVSRYGLPLTRAAVMTMFFGFGIMVYTWIPYIPTLQTRFALSEALLGWVLLTASVGAITGALTSSLILARVPSRVLGVGAEVAFCLTIPVLVLAPSLLTFILTYLVYGLAIGWMDVAINTQASAVEVAYGRPIISSFHALFSMGGLTGAGIAALAGYFDWPPGFHAAGVAMTLIVVVLFASRALIPPSREIPTERDAPLLVLPRGPLLMLGLLAFAALVIEVVLTDWGAVYIQSGLGASSSAGAVGLAMFSLMMAVGRFSGDWLAARLGRAAVIRLSGLIVAVGFGAALLIHHPVAAVVGLGCGGLGVANLFPLYIGIAGKMPGFRSGVAVSAVMTTAYTAFFIAPPLVGNIAELSTLSLGMSLVVVAGLLTAVFAGAINRT